MTTKHDNNQYDESVGTGKLPTVVSKARLLFPKDESLIESIRKVIAPEELSGTCIGFWGRFTPLEPKKRGRPFGKKRGGNIYDGEEKEEY